MKVKDSHPYSEFRTNTVTFHGEKSSHSYTPTHPESVDSQGQRCVTDMPIPQQSSSPFVRSPAAHWGSSLLFLADAGSQPCQHSPRAQTSPGRLGGAHAPHACPWDAPNTLPPAGARSPERTLPGEVWAPAGRARPAPSSLRVSEPERCGSHGRARGKEVAGEEELGGWEGRERTPKAAHWKWSPSARRGALRRGRGSRGCWPRTPRLPRARHTPPVTPPRPAPSALPAPAHREGSPPSYPHLPRGCRHPRGCRERRTWCGRRGRPEAAGDTRRAGLDGSERSGPGPGGEEAEATPPDRSGTAASRGGRGLACQGRGFQPRRRSYVMWGRV